MTAQLTFGSFAPKAFIFDFDGTLADSMAVWEYIDEEFLRRHNLEATDEYKELIIALGFEAGAKWVAEHFDLNLTWQAVMDEWIQLARDSYDKYVVLKPGAFDYLHAIKEAGFPVAIATSLHRSLLEKALAKNEIMDSFDYLSICDEHASQGKLEPTVYIEAAKALGRVHGIDIPFSDCVVFEDIGVAANTARKAGAYVIGVNDKTEEEERKSLEDACHQTIVSFEELLK